MLNAERHRPRGVGLAGDLHRTWAVAEKNDWQFSNPRIETARASAEQACAQMHLHLQMQVQMLHLHLHLHLIPSRRMHLHLHLHLIHPHLHLHLHLIQMHLIESNANQMRAE